LAACTCHDSTCGGKHPRITGWPARATTHPTTIQTWWTQWPDANIGIATGARSGLIVLDVDPRHGGEITLERLQRQHGALPPTVQSRTGGGGCHYYFQYPGPRFRIPSGVHKLGRGLDIKADGGYVVAPPSRHQSGQSYAWVEGRSPDDLPSLAALPTWMLQRLRALQGDAPAAPCIAVLDDETVASARDQFLLAADQLLPTLIEALQQQHPEQSPGLIEDACWTAIIGVVERAGTSG
jgi:hypothetical protein